MPQPLHVWRGRTERSAGWDLDIPLALISLSSLHVRQCLQGLYAFFSTMEAD